MQDGHKKRGIFVRRSTLWRVPVYCIVAGIVCFYLNSWLFYRFTVYDTGNGIAVDTVRMLIEYGAFFVAAIVVGGFVFARHMTRKELFWWASIAVLLFVVFEGIKWGMWIFDPKPSWYAQLWEFAWQSTQWSFFLEQLVFYCTGIAWLGSAAQAIAPYCLVFFGKKSIENTE